jgi:hypothetical protein
MDHEVECPFCGEPSPVDVDVDLETPGEHRFIQDCDVCCRPWAVRVLVDAEGEVSVEVERA